MHADVVHAVCTVYLDYFTSFTLDCSVTAGVVLWSLSFCLLAGQHGVLLIRLALC
jgi:hypothetical protein